MAITVPYSFTNATTADATEVNANFAAIIAKAMDKTGDTATGTIAFTGGFNIGSATSAIVVGSQATNDLIRAASATTLGRIATANDSVLGTNGSGVPAYTTTLPTGVQDNITRLGTVTTGGFPAANLTGTALPAGVVTSSLTTVGTITSGVWNAGAVTSSGAISGTTGAFGANAATAGNIRLPNATTVRFRNAANNGNIQALEVSASDLLNIGADDIVITPSTAITLARNTTIAGTLTVNGFGTHSFSAGGTGKNAISIANTTDGAANYAELRMTAGTSIGVINVLPQSFTTSGPYAASGLVIDHTGAGGLSIVSSHASAFIRFYYGTTEGLRLDNAGNIDIKATKKFYFDGGSNTYIHESSADTFGIVVGGTSFLSLSGSGSSINSGSATAINIFGDPYFPDADTVSGLGANAYINPSTGELNRDTSSARFKNDILPLSVEVARAALLKMSAVTFQEAPSLKGRTRKARNYVGFLAEDMATVAVDAVSGLSMLTGYKDSKPEWVAYSRIPAFIVPVVQDHEARIAALETKLAGVK